MKGKVIGMTTTYVIEGRANIVIKRKALIYQAPKPYQISKYGRIVLYRGKVRCYGF